MKSVLLSSAVALSLLRLLHQYLLRVQAVFGLMTLIIMKFPRQYGVESGKVMDELQAHRDAQSAWISKLLKLRKLKRRTKNEPRLAVA